MQIAFHPTFAGFDPATHCAEPGFSFRSAADPAELAELARESDALLIVGPRYLEPLARRISEPGSRLRLVQFLSAGYENAEFFGAPADAVLCNGSSIWAPAVAEHAVGLMLGLLRRIPELERRRVDRHWDRDGLAPRLGSLDGARVGILGYGMIGREIASRIGPFGAEVIGIARAPKPCDRADRVIALADLQEWLPRLDILVNVVPSSSATRHIVNGDVLSRLRSSALLINVGRGATVDEAALVACLRENRIGGAGLDVFETEPLPADNPLWSLENVILSPHCAGYGSAGIVRRAHDLCLDNLRALRDGGAFRSRVKL